MCQVFASQPPSSYECQTRSIRIDGHSTSVRLEAAFWAVLEEIAEREGTDLTKLVGKLHDEVLELHGEIRNFASLLRCCCLLYVSQLRTAPTHDILRKAAANGRPGRSSALPPVIAGSSHNP
jgi:predicted DNA-binding ribbon-helix-helix protein